MNDWIDWFKNSWRFSIPENMSWTAKILYFFRLSAVCSCTLIQGHICFYKFCKSEFENRFLTEGNVGSLRMSDFFAILGDTYLHVHMCAIVSNYAL